MPRYPRGAPYGRARCGAVPSRGAGVRNALGHAVRCDMRHVADSHKTLRLFAEFRTNIRFKHLFDPTSKILGKSTGIRVYFSNPDPPADREYLQNFFAIRAEKIKFRARPAEIAPEVNLALKSFRWACNSRRSCMSIVAAFAQCAPIGGIVRIVAVCNQLFTGARVVVRNRRRLTAQHTFPTITR